MLLDIKNDNKQSIVSFPDCDRIDTTNLKLIKEQLTPVVTEMYSNTNKDEQVLDFCNINFIDSSGLTMIINLYKNLLAHEKSLKIINVNDIVFDIFDVTKLNTFVQVSGK
jgi:anti-anti-sigma factor